LLRELVGIFLEDSPAWVEQIQASISRGDARGLKLSAHLLAGTASHFGAGIVTKSARRLEAMGQSGNLDGASEACAELLAAVAELHPALIELAQ
jgi:HPt (histidine-containing phosphotransfer) domain-containing protein